MIEPSYWNDDTDTESKVRQALAIGDVSSAKEWVRQINNRSLKWELLQVIREYES